MRRKKTVSPSPEPAPGPTGIPAADDLAGEPARMAPLPDEPVTVPPEGPDFSEPENALPPMSGDQITVKIRQAMTLAGWENLMPVQARTIPYVLARRDLMVQSRTGSGKTGAFMLPILERIDPAKAACQALILVPTRELALQVSREAVLLGKDAGILTAPVYGGAGYTPQIEALRKGAQLVIGTPGRLLDHLLRETLRLDQLDILIFDEADRLLSMGFYPDMRQLRKFLPRRERSTYMFSATFPRLVMNLAEEFMRKPDFLSLSKDRIHVAETVHIYYPVPAMEKDRCLVRILEMENPDSGIIFCNTRNRVHYVTVVLQRFGLHADELSSDLGQAKREEVMARLRKGELRFLVATDLAGRGIDIPELSHVFQFEIPEDQDGYIHRTGRTGRAGARGVAISLVSGMEEIQLKDIARKFNIDLQIRNVPTDEDIQALITERLTAKLEGELRGRDRIQLERIQRLQPLVDNLAEWEEARNILAMLLDDYYQKAVHGTALAPATPSPTPHPSGDRSRRRPYRR